MSAPHTVAEDTCIVWRSGCAAYALPTRTVPALAVPGEAARVGERTLGRALPPGRPLEVPLEQRLAQISSMLPRTEVLAAAPCAKPQA